MTFEKIFYIISLVSILKGDCMSGNVKTIGILTSGGDAPGMNAAIRAVARTAIRRGIKVFGINRGYNGLIEGDVFPMEERYVSNIIHSGGTCLYTARSPKFKTEEGIKQACENCKKFGIDGIVVIGGDGSYRGARDLSLSGIPCVGIPGTIDNDISSTDETVGFDTAMNTAMVMIDRLRDTSQSHDRCSVVEVMGRRCGDIALKTAIATGATAVLVPEIEFDLKRDVYDRILYGKKCGKNNFIIVVAEGVCNNNGVGDVFDISKKIEEATGVETRGTILGHVQRGGSPTLRDRVLASRFGSYAVDLVSQGIGNRVVCLKDNKIVDYDIYEALEMKKTIDKKQYEIAYEISI